MRVLISVLVLAMLVTAVHAQSTDVPTYVVGDTWKRSNGAELVVVKGDDTGYVMRGVVAACPTCLVHMDRQLLLTTITDGEGKPVDATTLPGVLVGPGWKFYDWPLEVKKKWTMGGTSIWKGNPQSYTVEITVKAYEEVKTPAGVFKAYRVEQHWRGRDSHSNWDFINTVWYAPEVKNVVKLISNNRNTKEWELLSFSLK